VKQLKKQHLPQKRLQVKRQKKQHLPQKRKPLLLRLQLKPNLHNIIETKTSSPLKNSKAILT
jgi:hypothetical protein